MYTLFMPNKPSPLAIAAGERLRRAREALDLGSGECAKRLGVSISRLSNWEAGTSLIGPAMVLRAKERLKITPDWIYAADPASLPKGLADKVLALRVVVPSNKERKRAKG